MRKLFGRLAILGSLIRSISCQGILLVEKRQEDRVLRETDPAASSFDLLCERLDSLPEFLCECVSQIPFRSIECQSTELCSRCGTCGQFIFQVGYMGPDISQLQSCVTYTKLPEGSSPNYMDGCFTLLYEGETVPNGCRLSFMEALGEELKECEMCSLCEGSNGESVSTGCDSFHPAATADCTPTQIEGFFPGFREGDCDMVSRARSWKQNAWFLALIVSVFAFLIQ